MMLALLAQSQDLSWIETLFVGLVDRALTSPLVTLAAVAAAFGVGVVHALAPGHGKAIAAAYLVGGRGRRRDALLLGMVVAAMHTVSVLALGLAFWLLLHNGSSQMSADAVSPVLRVLTGAAVLVLGIVLVVRVFRARGHGHRHDHVAVVAPFSRRGLVLLGMTGGVLPSPAAFLVLITTSFTGRPAFGIALVLMFSLGLATTLTGIGLAVVRGREALVERVSDATRRRLTAAAAGIGAAVVLAGGIIMTVAGALAL